ncbi:MAG: SLC13 family permease [Spirochaetia bacterium]|jgi:arsenical pump membrane protein
MVHALLGGVIFAATLAAIMIRPFRLNEALSAAAGALLMLAGGFVRPGEAAVLLLRQWNTFGFFLGLMAISALAEEAGIFDALAVAAARWGRGKAARLYLAVFAVGAVISVFLTNDSTALILTPVVYALVTRLRLPVLPFMFACTFIADTASFVLPVSNPINIIIQGAFGSTLGTYLRYLFPPSIVAISLNTALFLWLFRRELVVGYDPLPPSGRQPGNPRLLQVSWCILGLIAIAYILGSLLGVPLSFIALGGAAVMLVAMLSAGRLDVRAAARRVSWPIFLFIAGMLVVVRAVEDLGFTAAFGNALIRLSGGKPFPAILLVAGGTAIGANLINNVPMSLVMVSALRALPTSAPAYHSLPFAVIFGADLGPNLTTVGSLATMLWLLILRRRGLEISTREYFRLGVTFVPALILIGSLLIWARL